MRKYIGNGMLKWKELEEILLDVEVTLNNRPLSYIEDARHLLRCKEPIWKRWSREYLRSLRERHRAKIKPGPVPKVAGDAVIISDNEKKMGEWTLGIVEELVTGKDNEVRVAKICGSKSHLEQAVQQHYPLELSCDVEQPIPPVVMNPQAPVFQPRRDAAVAARERVRELIHTEET